MQKEFSTIAQKRSPYTQHRVSSEAAHQIMMGVDFVNNQLSIGRKAEKH